MSGKTLFTVFSKPWPTVSLAELGELIAGLGLDGIELPVRPGFQVEPQNVARDLPVAVRQLADFGLEICSIAGPTDEVTIATCGECGIPTIRIMARVERGEGYLEAESRHRSELDALVPLLEKHGVTVGIQNHANQFVANAVGLMRLIESYDPRQVAAVWDPGHEALNGNLPELAIDIVWSHLCMVNLKNAVWQRLNGPEAAVAEYKEYWTTGSQGLASWPRVAAELKRRGWQGVYCLTAEYHDHDSLDRLVRQDVAFAKALFA